ncbi:hypothetical protein HHK36_031969 [Tetracentron sinense]|uniref:Cytochrome b5 heme-binding domain-containing protein n=1 Tax=Tetracentron sinense TaxID=13715 RepID=A0A835CXK9_TETSI|nr:hypothetical protein HHK36_031969 [Tetracentron sinense]
MAVSAVHVYKTTTNGRSDSPSRVCNFLSNSELPLPKNTTLMEESWSDDEGEKDWKEYLNKANNEVEPSILDPRDEETADSWIKRNPSLIRLTGKHPFNSEPPLTRLMHQGFITPVQLHYVRNHGPVPKANWEDWTVQVSGLVKRPRRFTMDQLITEFPTREFPVTLVCAGNRRKEQNMMKQTIGFNWGAAAISTSVWRGVGLRDVLKRCGILSRRKGALNVCFEGAEDLPGGGGSKYGTSLRKEIAMDASRDIILAYMQNGELLLPDHGFPVRLIIPGFIGGRMVKWLRRIIVSTQESDSYYHYNDNRVLPSHVDAELANAEGAGRKVTRVEVTMDGGETWLLCALDQPVKPNKHGKDWCWCFWCLEVEVIDLIGAKEIAVRAWDETLNTQPENLTWNVMGMMNNCWFRVKSNPQKEESGIVFEHPIQPGNQPGGWMARQRQRQRQLDKSETDQTLEKIASSKSKMYSMSEVKNHNSTESAWIVVHGHIYDCTPFLKDHPGGIDRHPHYSGTDCTEEI